MQIKNCPKCSMALKLNRFGYYNCSGDCVEAFGDVVESYRDESLTLIKRITLAKHALVFAKSKARITKIEAPVKAREAEYAEILKLGSRLRAEDWLEKSDESEAVEAIEGRSSKCMQLREEAVGIFEILSPEEQNRVICAIAGTEPQQEKECDQLELFR